MDHLLVRRTAWALCGFLAVAALLFGWLTSRSRPELQPAAASGEALFARHCSACHDAAALPAPGAGTDLEAFLASHGDASPAEDRRIGEFLRRRR
jgi:mono/diheme cytochrome c family protein